MQIKLNKIYCGDSVEIMKQFPIESINCCITSPPYWGLRDYQTEPVIWDGDKDCVHEWGDKLTQRQRGATKGANAKVGNQINEVCGIEITQGQFCSLCGAWRGSLGLEPTFQLYIKHLCDIFDEVKRVLKKTGTCWVNIGDSYLGSGQGGGDTGFGKERHRKELLSYKTDAPKRPSTKYKTQAKSLAQIPSRFAIEMTNRGWILRNEIIWHKPNCLNGGTKLYAKTQKGVMPSTLKDLVRLNPETVELWDGNKWNQVISWIKNNNPKDIKKITLISDEKINCTGEHIFMVAGGRILVKDLKIGDILDNCILPDNNHIAELIPDEIGWLIGLYIAEGSRGNKKRCLQFSSHKRETERYIRLKKIAEQYDETCTEHITSDNGKTINIYSNILNGIIKSYVAGDNCYNKHLANRAWRRNNNFIKNILDGYLSGDGHWDEQNKRWRIGFTKINSYLANDLRTMCARLGYDFRISKNKNSYQGNIRITKSNHFNNKNSNTIKSITTGKMSGKYWDIVLKDTPNVFSTIGGTLIHNCMPQSCKDRFTVDFEKVFFFTKNKKYWFEQQKEPMAVSSIRRLSQDIENQIGSTRGHGTNKTNGNMKALGDIEQGRNKRCIWKVATQPFKEAHFATFPEALIEPMLKAGCPEGGIILDPFFGAGTTGLVAVKQNKHFIGIELNEEYCEIARKRINVVMDQGKLF